MRLEVGGAADDAMPVTSLAAAAGLVVEVLVEEDARGNEDLGARGAEFVRPGARASTWESGKQHGVPFRRKGHWNSGL